MYPHEIKKIVWVGVLVGYFRWNHVLNEVFIGFLKKFVVFDPMLIGGLCLKIV